MLEEYGCSYSETVEEGTFRVYWLGETNIKYAKGKQGESVQLWEPHMGIIEVRNIGSI